MAVKALQDVSCRGGGALGGTERDSCVCARDAAPSPVLTASSASAGAGVHPPGQDLLEPYSLRM